MNMVKNEQYEQLIRWTIRNVDKRLYNPVDLAYSVQELDIHNVISTHNEFISFAKDLEKRTGRNILNQDKAIKEDAKRSVVRKFFDNHYINFSKWELDFMRNVKDIKKYSEKQEGCIIKIMNKIDKRYVIAFTKAGVQ